MDVLTHALFGATIANTGFRRRLGGKAVLAGAAVALMPDLDGLIGWIGGPFASWTYHRAITHSVFFGPVVGLLLGWAIWVLGRWRRGYADPDKRAAWIGLAILALATHPILDLFTSYGTQLLAPFSGHRFAIDAMPIIEPVYTLGLALGLLLGTAWRRRPGLSSAASGAALVFVAAYTLYGWSLNARVEAEARAQLHAAGVQPTAVNAYPLVFQSFFRRVVAETHDTVLVGFHSVLVPGPIAWEEFPRTNDPRIHAVAGTREAGIFDWFALGRTLWRAEPQADGTVTVTATDLRYGMAGETVLGFWGIRAVVDAAGRVAGPLTAFSRLPRSDAAAWRDYWRATFGDRAIAVWRD